MSNQLDCVACEGTGVSSKGLMCTPCFGSGKQADPDWDVIVDVRIRYRDERAPDTFLWKSFRTGNQFQRARACAAIGQANEFLADLYNAKMRIETAKAAPPLVSKKPAPPPPPPKARLKLKR